MRTTKRLLILVVALALPLAAVATANAAKPDCDVEPHPSCKDSPTPPTTTVPTVWTCQARIDNGASWILGSWSAADGSYTVSGVPACIDLRSEHAGDRQWAVTWEGELKRGTVTGLMLLFETEVHGTHYDETVVYTESGDPWLAEVNAPDGEAFVFVAMAQHRDKWESITFTVTPLPVP